MSFISWHFGIYLCIFCYIAPILVHCIKKNLAALFGGMPKGFASRSRGFLPLLAGLARGSIWPRVEVRCFAAAAKLEN
jgi:hypothetical protein